jgi:hypothetical protein
MNVKLDHSKEEIVDAFGIDHDKMAEKMSLALEMAMRSKKEPTLSEIADNLQKLMSDNEILLMAVRHFAETTERFIEEQIADRMSKLN